MMIAINAVIFCQINVESNLSVNKYNPNHTNLWFSIHVAIYNRYTILLCNSFVCSYINGFILYAFPDSQEDGITNECMEVDEDVVGIDDSVCTFGAHKGRCIGNYFI